MSRIAPSGPAAEARQRAELLAALWAASGVDVDLNAVLEAWGFGDPAWDTADHDAQYTMTEHALRLALGG